MGTDYIKYYGDLQQELQDAKHTLITLNDNIRRIVGRNPKEIKSDKYKTIDLKKIDSDRQGVKISEISKFKRRGYDTKSVFNRLSAPAFRYGDEDDSKPRINSRVIRELPTRQEVVAAQGNDSESRARNRRMFGSLIGTLHKFCQEESRLKQREEKKAQIEKKLEEQEIQEREILKKERELLFLGRKKKQCEIRILELKMERLKDFENWESSEKCFKHFIKTKTKPFIYFKPRIMCNKMEKLLMDGQISVEKTLEKKRDALNKELFELENSLKIQWEKEECFDNNTNDNFAGEDIYKCQDLETKNELYYKCDDTMDAHIIFKKGDPDSKENKNKHTNDPVLSSSIVVVKN